MIKGSLLMSLPRAFFGTNFLSENAHFLLSFSDPLKNPPDGYVWNLRTRPSSQTLIRPAIYGAKRRSAVFTEIRLIKKERKTQTFYNSLPLDSVHQRGGCNYFTCGYFLGR